MNHRNFWNAERSGQVLAAAVLMVFACLATALNHHENTTAAPSAPAPDQIGDSLKQALARAITLGEPFQPSPQQQESFSRVVHSTDEGVLESRDQAIAAVSLLQPDILLHDDLPYFAHRYLERQDAHVIHPMALGRYLLDNAAEPEILRYAGAARRIAVELPNNGLAWYYPRHYRNARMLGPDLRYSGISQGTLLSGFTAAAIENAQISFVWPKQVFRAMTFAFESGGVNLADRAILEYPSFRAAPEIILNGWLDALLHVHDYAEVSGDLEAREFFKNNVAFLTEVLDVFDAADVHVSRYSDLCPYRVRIELNSKKDVDSLRALYVPRRAGLPAYLVPLKRLESAQKQSIYDNQIVRISGKVAHANISCSQLYSTYLLSNGPSMGVTMRSGVVNRQETTPGQAGAKLQLHSRPFLDGSVIAFDDVREQLIAGYPTNFLKAGHRNYYHVYHVAALMMLARTGELTEEQSRTVLMWALRWLQYIEEAQLPDGVGFQDLQDVLDRTNSNRFKYERISAFELVELSRLRLGQLRGPGAESIER